jgi:hypothetical protein
LGTIAGLDDVEKRKFLTLPGLELRSLGRRASSQSAPCLQSHLRDAVSHSTKKTGYRGSFEMGFRRPEPKADDLAQNIADSEYI